MTILHLITHAHTEATAAADARGWALSATGVEQAETLARQPFWDEVDQIFVSSEAKTALTAQPVVERRAIPVEVDPRFDELRRGGWLDDYAGRVAAAFAEPDKPAGDWESASDALTRFLDGITDLHSRHQGRTIALVGHGLTLSLFRAHLRRQPRVNFADWQQLSFAAVAIVALHEGLHGDPPAGKLIQDFAPVADPMGRGAETCRPIRTP